MVISGIAPTIRVGLNLFLCNNISDDLVDRASASGDVSSGLIPSQLIPMTLKLVFTASLLDAQH